MDIQEIKTHINNFKAIKAKGSITPESLGSLLEEMFSITEQQGLRQHRFNQKVGLATTRCLTILFI